MTTLVPFHVLHRRRARLSALGIGAILVAVLLPAPPAAADPVPPDTGEITGTLGIGSYDENSDSARVICDDPRSLTEITLYRVSNEVFEPVTGVEPTCTSVSADTGVVTLSDPQQFTAIGDISQDDISASSCPPGAVATGFRGQAAGVGEIAGLQLLCSYLNADGTLTPAPPGQPAFFVPDEGDVEITCDEGQSAVGINGATAGYYEPNSGEITFFALECAALTFADQPPVDGDLNTTWPAATVISDSTPGSNLISAPGQARWYKFAVTPDSTVQVDVTGLAANYDLTVFKDIDQQFTFLSSSEDLALLGAEFAADAYSPSAFSPSAFSPSAFSPSAFSPSAFSPSAFSPSASSPSAFSPSAFSPSAFSPSAFSPSAFSPSAFSPAVALPSAFSSSSLAPRGLTEAEFVEAFSSAQTRSLIAVSAREGTADESVKTATWGNTGFFYVRVQGRNGATSTEPFQVSLITTGGSCETPLDTFPESETHVGEPGTAQTVILTDTARLPGLNTSQLQAFADRPEIDGVVIDAADVPLLRELNDQADALVACPYAKNLVAQAMRDIVNTYRDSAGTLQYVVLVGADDVIPFFRYADSAGLGPEQDYVPPVADATASQASLRRNQVLSQDAYGSLLEVDLKGAIVPVPDLAVGRLVETTAEIAATIDRYTALAGGTLPTPSTSLVTGYDFLTDAADAVADQLEASVGGAGNDELITDQGVPPTVTTVGGSPDRQHSWTATDLRQALLGEQRHDITFLAGHFSANSTLAADYETTLLTTDLVASSTDFADTLVLSPGCHSGYTIVDGHVVPDVTLALDWTQAFVQKGATLIAGTGYQYGDTDFLEYSERLYNGVITELRTGSGPVPVGAALTAAKQEYLASTVTLTGIHQKSLLEATLYGLPMLGLDLPTGRIDPPTEPGVTTDPVGTDPGQTLELRTSTATGGADPELTTRPRVDIDGNPTGVFTNATGPDGVVTNPGRPALPLDSQDVTSSTGEALRGVGWRTGTYADTTGVTPLTGAPATEINAVHTPFVSAAFFPPRLATANYFDALGAPGTDGRTRLNITPAQYRTDGAATNTLRTYSSLGFSLFYSANTQTYENNTPALAAPPTFAEVQSTVDGNEISISTRVTGDPSAGIQTVWVTYTAEAGPRYGTWESLDLVQDAADSTLWTATLTVPAGQAVADVRFLVQAVNGVGLVALDDNQGFYYLPGTAPGLTPPTATDPSTLTLDSPTEGTYRDALPVSATLTGPDPVSGRTITFTAGTATVSAVTDTAGTARAELPLIDRPGEYQVTAAYDGDDTTLASSAENALTINKQPSQLSLVPESVSVPPGADPGMVATLTAADLPLREKPVYLVVRDGAGQVVDAVVGASDLQGEVELGPVDLVPGTYAVTASFGAESVDLGETTVNATDPDFVTSTATATLVVQDSGEPVPPGCTITGTPGNDILYGTNGKDVICALGGNDIVYASNGKDTVYGGGGNDVLYGSNGNDTLDGGDGNDTLYGSNGNDTLNAGAGNDVAYGSNGKDTVVAGGGTDSLAGDNGKDVLDALDGAGGDSVAGGNGKDTCRRDPGDIVDGCP